MQDKGNGCIIALLCIIAVPAILTIVGWVVFTFVILNIE